jgi:hypothetical protein
MGVSARKILISCCGLLRIPATQPQGFRENFNVLRALCESMGRPTLNIRGMRFGRLTIPLDATPEIRKRLPLLALCVRLRCQHNRKG